MATESEIAEAYIALRRVLARWPASAIHQPDYHMFDVSVVTQRPLLLSNPPKLWRLIWKYRNHLPNNLVIMAALRGGTETPNDPPST